MIDNIKESTPRIVKTKEEHDIFMQTRKILKLNQRIYMRVM